MKVVTIWQNSGAITLVRDSKGDLYTPKETIPTPDTFDLHIPIHDEIEISSIQLPDGMLCFVDALEDSMGLSSEKLSQLLESDENSNLLIVTASDSIERKERLAKIALGHTKMTRILEVSLPICFLGPTLTKSLMSYSDVALRRKTNFLRQEVYNICSTEPHLTSIDSLTLSVLKQFAEHRELWFPGKADGSCYLTSEYEFASKAFYHSQLVSCVVNSLVVW